MTDRAKDFHAMMKQESCLRLAGVGSMSLLMPCNVTMKNCISNHDLISDTNFDTVSLNILGGLVPSLVRGGERIQTAQNT